MGVFSNLTVSVTYLYPWNVRLPLAEVHDIGRTTEQDILVPTQELSDIAYNTTTDRQKDRHTHTSNRNWWLIYRLRFQIMPFLTFRNSLHLNKYVSVWSIGQEPIFCIRSVRQLACMLQGLTPNPTLNCWILLLNSISSLSSGGASAVTSTG